MYTVTFYSFKGGVGRTMALVNVGLALAKEGRRVLLVDFDLEAPGIETFSLLRPSQRQPGLVDFVHAYKSTGIVPNVRDYVCEFPAVASRDGKVWLMPSGMHGPEYGSRLGEIDWADLYADQEGYLLFEDLRAQWAEALAPDYVLIDSRTGYTDVGGICTRQLPDAVVFLFFPNDQNLEGLTRVVEDVRTETTRQRKPIERLFVPSNVPDLDDEESILAQRLETFRKAFGYTEPAVTIRHYNSLALLNQVVFTIERKGSRLAGEYRALMREIQSRNTADRDGALEYLRRLQRGIQHDEEWGDPQEVIRRLDEIERKHPDAADVLLGLAAVNEMLGRIDEALHLIDGALRLTRAVAERPVRRAELLLRKTRLLQQAAQPGAAADIRATLDEVLNSDDAGPSEVGYAINRLRRLKTSDLAAAFRSPAYLKLSTAERCSLLEDTPSEDALPLARLLVRDILKDLTPDTPVNEDHRLALSLHLIALGHFREALSVISPTRPENSESITVVFNWSMAEWALTGAPPRDLFERALVLDRSGRPTALDPNYEQCLAVASHFAGESQEADLRLRAAQRAEPTHARVFSAWRYLRVNARAFRRDLEELERLLGGESITPAFFRKQGAGHHEKGRQLDPGP